MSYDQAYLSGYAAGRTDGLDDDRQPYPKAQYADEWVGYRDGYDVGFEQGYAEGVAILWEQYEYECTLPRPFRLPDLRTPRPLFCTPDEIEQSKRLWAVPVTPSYLRR